MFLNTSAQVLLCWGRKVCDRLLDHRNNDDFVCELDVVSLASRRAAAGVNHLKVLSHG